MTWKDQLRKAKFRGAEFEVDSADTTVGRRTVAHTYPGRDRAYTEDLGRIPPEFTVEAYVIGPDYMRARDKLRAALEKPGPGILVHPYYGTVRVAVADQVRIRETARRGGMAEFSIPFVEAGEQPAPGSRADTAKQTQQAADAGIADAKAAAAARFSTDGLPPSALDQAMSQVQGVVDTVGTLADSIPTNPAALAQFRSQMTSLRNSINQLVEAPFELADNIAGAIQDVGYLATDMAQLPDKVEDLYDGTVGKFEAAFSQFQHLGDYESPIKPPQDPSTPGQRQQAANAQAIDELVRRTAAVEAARASSASRPETRDRAEGMLAWVEDALDALAESASETVADPLTPADAADAEDRAYLSLVRVRTATAQDLRGRALQLPELTTYTPTETLPALVLAQQLYGDASRADELVARNEISHPGQVPGGQPLEVVSYG